MMEITVTGSIIEWRGPAPYWFLPIGPDDSAMIDELKPMLTYGWGCIPVGVPTRRYVVRDLDHAP